MPASRIAAAAAPPTAPARPAPPVLARAVVGPGAGVVTPGAGDAVAVPAAASSGGGGVITAPAGGVSSRSVPSKPTTKRWSAGHPGPRPNFSEEGFCSPDAITHAAP